MHNVDWLALLSALLQLFINIVLLSLVSTVLAALILKFFYRNVDFKQLAGLCFWAIFRILIITAILYAAVVIGHIRVPTGVDGLLSLLGVCALGWLITHDMQRYGVPKKFPGPGFKVVIGLVLVSWILVGIGFLIYSAV